MALLRDAEPEIHLAMRIAIYAAAGHRRSEIQRLSGATPNEFRAAHARLKRIAPTLDPGD